MPPTHVPEAEFERRLAAVREELASTDADALCLFSAIDIEYLAGFHHLQTERPVCLAVTPDETALAVPRLELDRAAEAPLVEEVYHYYDYPGGERADSRYYHHPSATPEETIAAMLADLGVGAVVADADGAPGYWGYSGPPLSEFAGVAILISVTVLVTASVGLFVLVSGSGTQGGPAQANFSYQYIEDSSVLLVTHERGDTFDARNLTVRGEEKAVPWHELAGSNETAPVGPGTTVQLSSNNAWGENVARGDTVRVVYTPPSGNETVLSEWDSG
ncbi:MAG: aminopeptidase P family N-terminal domain-containing protein [Halobacteriaceae archaeon]